MPRSEIAIIGAPLDNVTLFTPQYISPLEFNNAIRGNINVDYRFDKGEGGPILEQLGASLLLSFNSGHPYTRGTGGASLESDARNRQPVEPLNASTTPWFFQADLRIDKTFSLGSRLSANLFINVINLLDTRNILNVFLRTGSTTDDGYLSNPTLGQPLLAIVPTDDIWVTANFKETQIEHMHVGQRVRLQLGGRGGIRRPSMRPEQYFGNVHSILSVVFRSRSGGRAPIARL